MLDCVEISLCEYESQERSVLKFFLEISEMFKVPLGYYIKYKFYSGS